MRSFISTLIFIIGYTIFASANWVVRKFGVVTYEQIMFHLNMPFDSERRLVLSYLKSTLMTGGLILIGLVLIYKLQKKLKWRISHQIFSFIYDHRLLLGLLWFAFSCVWFFFKMNVINMITYRQYKFEVSNFYEENYVLPQQAQLTFPARPKNLILIFAESMESAYAKTKTHNYFDIDLIPNLHNLIRDNTHFSDQEDVGGSFEIDGTQWTQAGLFAQTCGLPIQLPIKDTNLFHPKGPFYPNAYCLYDILATQNYNQVFMIGSNGEFAGMNRFVETHHQQTLRDLLFYAERDGVHLSFEKANKLPDKQLYGYAKEELNKLSQGKEPFVFTMMTFDTHFGTGHFEDSVCQRRFGHKKNMKDVVSCSDNQLGQFIDWIKQQSFYKDTVIVVLGDHLTMNSFFTPDMDRKPINIFINSSMTAKQTQNRTFTPFDIYPTIVESMGIQIQGHRLALGTSLYSNTPTLTEGTLTVPALDINVRKKSKLYDWLLYGKDIY